MADAVAFGKRCQKTPDGCYNLDRMLKRFAVGAHRILLCGTCMDARGLAEAALIEGARRSTMDELAPIGPEVEACAFYGMLSGIDSNRPLAIVWFSTATRNGVCRTPATCLFLGQRGTDLLSKTPNVAASTGSACHMGEITVSPVLEAMGVAREVGAGASRFSRGRGTTEHDVETVVEHLRRPIL